MQGTRPAPSSPYGASAKSKKRKLLRNETALAPIPPELPRGKLSLVKLEEKKTLLPYLEKIEYINAQLRQRGLEVGPAPLSEQPSGLPAASASNNHAPVEASDDQALSSRSEPDVDAPLTLARLRQRFPRFVCASSGLLRDRPIAWLFRFVDDVYEAYFRAYASSRVLSSFALFARQFVNTNLGVAADQDIIDVACTLERHAHRFHGLRVFAAFLREIEDNEFAYFHCHLRHYVQESLGLRLKTKDKVAHPDVAKKVLPPGSVVLGHHPDLRDGTQVVYVAKDAMVHTLYAACFPKEKTLARFYANTSLPFRHVTTVGPSGDESSSFVLELDALLGHLVEDLHRVPEDIVAAHKFNDDGESLTLLTRLQDTISHDAGIVTLKAALETEKRGLRRLETQRTKLDRQLTSSVLDDVVKAKLKTQSFLLDNQLHATKRDVDDLRHRIALTEAQVNTVWSSVLSDAATPSAPPASPRARILHRFRDAVARRYANHLLEQKVAAKLLERRRKGKQANAWSDQLDALQERSAIRIQRLFRQRRAWRRDRHAAQTAFHARRAAAKKRKAEQEMERKRLEALRARDAEKHRSRLAEKHERDASAAAARKAKEDAVLRAAALNQAEKLHAAATRALTQRVFARWRRYVTIAKKAAAAHQTSLRWRFQRWHHYLRWRRDQHKAATMLQALYRGHRGRKAGQLVARRAQKKLQLATRSVQRLQQRFLCALWQQWRQYATTQAIVKARCRDVLQRSLYSSFTQWAKLLSMRRASALVLQRLWRGHRGRVAAAHARALQHAALLVQKTYRGHLGRRVAALRRRLRATQHHGVNQLLQRLLRQSLWRVFQSWQSRWAFTQLCRDRTTRRIQRRHAWCFHLWQRYRVYRILKRAERYRRQFAAATCIQRSVRGFLARTRFHALVRNHRAAKILQRTVRGYLCRAFYRHTLALHRCALRIQCGWRRRKAIRTVDRRRNAFVLDAAVRGDYSVVLRAINAGRGGICDDDGNSLLHLSCLGGAKRLVKLCLRYQMDVGGVNHAGRTPLHMLVAAPHAYRAELIDYLIDHGAWQEARDSNGETPLLLATSLNHVDCIEVLLRRAADVHVVSSMTHETPIMTAVAANFLEAAHLLLGLGRCSPHATDLNDGATLLHDAAARGFVEMVQLLLAHGANIDAVDVDGSTPIMYAIYNDQPQMLRFLLEAGAAPDMTNVAGLGAIHIAIDKPAHASLLAAFNADVNAWTLQGETPLHLSCRSDSLLESSRVLLSFGAAIDAKNRRGNLPAHIAAKHGAAETMRLLIEYSTNMNMRNYDNKNPLGEARMHHQLGVIDVIQFHFAQEMKTLDEMPPVLDEDGVALPQRSTDEWRDAYASAVTVSMLHCWSQCVDAVTGAIFYHDAETDECTWRAPVEYQAALGAHWHPMSRDDGSYVYCHDVTNDVSTTVPPIDPLRLQALVQGIDEFKMLRSRIHRVSSETAAATAQYKSFWTNFDAETKAERARYLAAVAIQRTYKGHVYRRRLRALKVEHKTALHLQRVYRGRIARRHAAQQRHRVRCALKLQALGRGFLTRLHERQSWHAWRVQVRTNRIAANTIQRVWRGLHGRRDAKRARVIQHGPRTFFNWEDARKHASLVSNFSVWDELLLAGTSPIVGVFYCNQITGQCVWDKPPLWVERDYQAFLDRQQLYYYGYTACMLAAALRIQSQFRARTARVMFRRLLEGVRLARHCERAYMAEPTNLTCLGNYALYLHALLHDYAKAGVMYGHLVDLMAARGPDIAFVLRCYAIFLFVTGQDERDPIALLFERAAVIDPRKRKFELAFGGFFRYALVLFPESAQSHVNYAACLDWVYTNVTDATAHYLRALELDPHNARTVDLFDDMLDRHGLLEAGNASERFMQHQANAVARDDARVRKAYEDDAEAARRTAAAITIQTRFRTRKTQADVQQMQLSRRLRKLAKPLSPLHETLQAAFLLVAARNSSKATIRLSQLGALYERLGLSSRAADEDRTFASYFHEFDYPDSITLTRFLKWWDDGASRDVWEACTSDEGYLYYYNRATGESVWDAPRFQRRLDDVADQPLLGVWEECRTEDGTPYYVNARTGASSWENPLSAPPPWEPAVDDGGRVYYYNRETGASVWTIAEASHVVSGDDAWELVQTDDGLVYFYNRLSGETVWTKPDETAWETLQDDDGNVYYYNRTTGVSQWDSPYSQPVPNELE
ncbi:hypothetical protein SDRG_11672 [Saprolegnia diclina VS20]|uniref:WW domain-containing protein n=1 Tax=Saprolegnia diclina (strain VS20) TaxID=1156394 RepID=T0RL16_SAPDV|nr:hypothetical protein SDRG_11672 [Saprolegnia diclina VS20]EQC30617.1 hypothetical protein SDRG_11672 [Saprolegnia diclina VS20]|eukprot:XP_008615943.1 hypothetical protein SDRG_11672 [Saprolegnia diclina VS20]